MGQTGMTPDAAFFRLLTLDAAFVAVVSGLAMGVVVRHLRPNADAGLVAWYVPQAAALAEQAQRDREELVLRWRR